ncbi:hypothetical protein PR202_ga18365 [Eleusine coracana subsp. coracana]|uniref:TF-B3 domain-containing protein n=1 Tax=Eleusine coracana subsp. coracana TaxID=191504 RepID=A0AAV5CSP2_ELECO|nr:hypothetical protein QOZ80_6AG0506280 [Eleusine coracana subsp. coracana]GJN01126.1 hypothetical protein PR202_ga18365 [Eleusine coracana subsp. coracana]
MLELTRSLFVSPSAQMETPVSASSPSKQLPDASTTLKLEAGIKPKLPDPCTIFKLETASPSEQLSDSRTTLKLEVGIKPQLPDPCITFNLEHGTKPKLPDPCTVFKLEAGVKQPKLPDSCTQLKLEADTKPPKLPDACVKTKIEPGIEPKPEPCDDDAPVLPPPRDDWEITPVSGNNPFFTTVLSRSQVQKQFQLSIPARFQRHLSEARVPAVLLCRGKSWEASYCGDLKGRKLDAAWRDFAVDNRLRVGDACVFELMGGAGTEAEAGKVVFRVQVLRGDLPEEVTSKGATSDEPLVILD